MNKLILPVGLGVAAFVLNMFGGTGAEGPAPNKLVAAAVDIKEGEVITNENGDFEILDLPRGSYKLSASHTGFKTFVADNVVLESSQVRRINVPFELGATNVEVSVRADAAVIATESSKIQEQFEKQRFEEMPLIGDGRVGEHEHDIAAGVVITSEAGCEFGNLAGERLTPAEMIRRTPIKVPTFIAAPKRLVALQSMARPFAAK